MEKDHRLCETRIEVCHEKWQGLVDVILLQERFLAIILLLKASDFGKF
jgi:hypothetical protein